MCSAVVGLGISSNRGAPSCSPPAQGPAWYRLEGEGDGSASEIAVPCGLFSKDAGVAGAWPATQGAPVGSGFVWQDDDGDGLMRAAEFTALSDLRLGGVWGSWEDEAGNLWVVSEDHWMLGELPARSNEGRVCTRALPPFSY